MHRILLVLSLCLAPLPMAAQDRPGSGTVPVPDHITLESAPVLNLKDCLLRGGRIDTWPFTGERVCNLPTTDGGQPCATGADCQSYCLAETRQCHGYQSLGPGCHSFIEADGQTVTLCAD